MRDRVLIIEPFYITLLHPLNVKLNVKVVNHEFRICTVLFRVLSSRMERRIFAWVGEERREQNCFALLDSKTLNRCQSLKTHTHWTNKCERRVKCTKIITNLKINIYIYVRTSILRTLYACISHIKKSFAKVFSNTTFVYRVKYTEIKTN